MEICVTGASSGIGREIVKQLIKEGQSVFAVARRMNLLEELRNEVGEQNLSIFECDVQDEGSVEKLKSEMLSRGFRPASFVLAHGIFTDDIGNGFDFHEFKKNMAVNLDGTLNVVNSFLPKMIKDKNGHFVVLSSIAAFRPNLRGIGYSASKAAVGLTFRGLGLFYKKRGVAFSTVYLGPVATTMWEGEKSVIVSSPQKVAKRVIKVLQTKENCVFAPFFSTSVMRILSFLPDSCYSHLTNLIKHDYKK